MKSIDISAQFGGKDCAAIILPHFRTIKKNLKPHHDNRYCESIDKFCFILRVDGQVSQWNLAGCDNIDLSLKDRYISIDIGVPIKIWQKHDDSHIANYFKTVMIEGLNFIISFLLEKNIEVKQQELLNDLRSGLNNYVSEIGGTGEQEGRP